MTDDRNEMHSGQLTEEDRKFFASMGRGGVGFTGDTRAESSTGEHAINASDPDIDFDEMIEELVNTFYTGGPNAFAQLIDSHRRQLTVASLMSERLKRIVVSGLRLGVEAGSGECANELGALYYTGGIVDQDYLKAAELYGMAASQGILQAILNLGYIYEYGRLGEPDYQMAYMFFSYAAATAQSPEALYKMGDFFSKGKGVERDLGAAYVLWSQSLARAQELDDIENEAQASYRIARTLMSHSKCEEIGIAQDFMAALKLFQTAEIGLRISIDKGLTYYQGRLEKAMKGQQRARKKLGD